MKTKEEYIDSLTLELKEYSVQIDRWTAMSEDAVADVKKRCNEELEALRVKQQAASEKIKELQGHSGDAWDSIKDSADKIWEEIRVGVASVASKFD